MKILVAIKRVVDPNVKIRLKSDGSGIDFSNLKMAMNPFDEIAVEEAIRLKEKNAAIEVIAISIGSSACHDILRTALALGADRAIHVESADSLESLSVAKILKAIVEKEKPALILLGKQAIDSDNNQTGQMLAALLSAAQGTFISALTLTEEKATVTREIDGGLETIDLTLPAVITTDLRLNTPRYATLPNIMKAKKKPLETISVNDLGVTLKAHYRVLKISPPPLRKQGVKVASVDELIQKLKQEARVI